MINLVGFKSSHYIVDINLRVFQFAFNGRKHRALQWQWLVQTCISTRGSVLHCWLVNYCLYNDNIYTTRFVNCANILQGMRRSNFHRWIPWLIGHMSVGNSHVLKINMRKMTWQHYKTIYSCTCLLIVAKLKFHVCIWSLQEYTTHSPCDNHDEVIKWKHFPRYWPFVRGIHRSTVNSPHKGQWRGALIFSLISAWINDLVNNREAGDLRRHFAHYDVIVMSDMDLFNRNTFLVIEIIV